MHRTIEERHVVLCKHGRETREWDLFEIPGDDLGCVTLTEELGDRLKGRLIIRSPMGAHLQFAQLGDELLDQIGSGGQHVGRRCMGRLGRLIGEPLAA
jgi:hypothetical protein